MGPACVLGNKNRNRDRRIDTGHRQYISLILVGGTDIGAETMTRFFAIHVMILPITIAILLLLHFAMVRIQGISGRL